MGLLKRLRECDKQVNMLQITLQITTLQTRRIQRPQLARTRHRLRRRL